MQLKGAGDDSAKEEKLVLVTTPANSALYKFFMAPPEKYFLVTFYV
jgi:hypothetical protein